MAAVEAQISGLPVICSDELPNEAKICHNLHFMPLRKSASDWAQEAVNISQGNIRHDMSIYAKEKGFDIEEQALKMSKWYSEILGLK